MQLEARKNLTDRVADRLRESILDGHIPSASFLPTERDLARAHRVSRVTVRRSLALLVSEGLLEAVPSQGYRPRPSATANETPNRLAYVVGQAGADNWDPTLTGILSAFQRVLLPHGTAVLAEGIRDRAPEDVFRELARTGVRGVALDSSNPAIQAAAVHSRLPLVVVDSVGARPDVDTVIQDNHAGGRMAAEYLLSKGHTRIGWVGPTRGFAHWTERFSGVREALWSAGVELHREDILQPGHCDHRSEAEEWVRRRMAESTPPTAFVCPWQMMLLGAADALKGRRSPPELCGWSSEREYRELLAPEFLGGLIPATITWRPEEMAQLAWERIELRARNPQVVACRINVCVRLATPQSADKVIRG